MSIISYILIPLGVFASTTELTSLPNNALASDVTEISFSRSVSYGPTIE